MGDTALFLGSGASRVFDFPTSLELLESLSYEENHYFKKIIEFTPSNDMEEILQTAEQIQKSIKVLQNHNFFYLYEYQKGSPNSTNQGPQYVLMDFITQIDSLIRAVTQTLVKAFNPKKITKPILEQTYLLFLNYLMENQNKLDIFTTNYDRVLEEFFLCYDDKYSFNEGADKQSGGTIDPNLLELSRPHPNQLLLNVYRLHGALDWLLQDPSFNLPPKKILSKIEGNNISANDLVLIPPILGKNTKDHPFLSKIFNLYETKISTYETLIIVGFSFRDKDISELIKTRIKKDEFITIIISPHADKNVCVNLFDNVGDNPTDSHISQTCQDLQKNHKKLRVIKRSFDADNIPTIIKKIDEFKKLHSPEIIIQIDKVMPPTKNNTSKESIPIQGFSDLIEYTITGGGQLLNITLDMDANSLIVGIDATRDGTLTLTIPRSILDALHEMGKDDEFFVLINGEEADFSEDDTSSTDRTLTMIFHVGVGEFEIIGTKLSNNKNSISQDPSVSVTTDKASYSEGETIVITGEVRDLYSGTPVSVIVKAPNGNLVSITQVEIGSDKKFSTEMTAGGALMKSEGAYIVTAQYGTANRSAETTFEF